MDALLAGQEFAELLEPLIGQVPPLKHFILTGPERPGAINFDRLTRGQPPEPPQVEVDPHRDIERIHYTSGTTGRPKGAIWPFGMSYHSVTSVLINMDRPMGPEDVNLNIGPLTHAAGLMMMVYYSKGATNIILPRFDEQNVLETIQRERVTSVLFIPTMLYRLLLRPDIRDYDLSSVKRVWYGTAPMAPDRLKQGMEIFGNVFRQNYGMTEIPQPITFLGPEDHVTEGEPRVLRRLSSAGRPAMGVEVRILDEDGQELGPGQVGEIVLRSNKLVSGYWNMPQETAESFKDGWFHTRDMGAWDEDGFLYIKDRKSDMIISGGFNVYPREVEEVIMGLEGVAEAVVVGVPHELWGEAIKALVLLKPGAHLTPKEIMDHCGRNLSGYKKPKSVEFIDKVPRNHYGKIDRRALREPYWRDKDRRVN